MTLQEFKSKIDDLWEEFWTGGIANPLSVIEQITFLIFIKMLDDKEKRNEKIKARTGKDFTTIFKDFKLNPKDEDSETIKAEEIRWSYFEKLSADEMLSTVRDKVFPFIRQCSFSKTSSGSYLKDAQILITKPSLLSSAVSKINDLPLHKDDVKGNLYEYLLKKLTTSGINGQFRTPRHIIEMMVSLVDPQKTDKICDPACGTAGFLAIANNYIMKQNTSETGISIDNDGSPIYSGDMLKETEREHIKNNVFYGFDFDASMLRISAMNMMLHGIDNPNIHYQDCLSQNFLEKRPEASQNFFNIILANPPFKGSLDYEDVSSDLLETVKTKKTELLFLALMLRMLKIGGKAAVIVPAGVLSTEQKAYKTLRQKLIEDNQLEAVITMPSGVFKPYAGVATAVLIFTKSGKTKDVWFYEMEADGFSLDDKRNPINKNDIPDIKEKFKTKAESKKSFSVSIEKLKEEEYSLLPSRYKEIEYIPKIFKYNL